MTIVGSGLPRLTESPEVPRCVSLHFMQMEGTPVRVRTYLSHYYVCTKSSHLKSLRGHFKNLSFLNLVVKLEIRETDNLPCRQTFLTGQVFSLVFPVVPLLFFYRGPLVYIEYLISGR